jgi:hypothetical protein
MHSKVYLILPNLFISESFYFQKQGIGKDYKECYAFNINITPQMNFNTNVRYVGRNTILALGNVIMIDEKINALRFL